MGSQILGSGAPAAPSNVDVANQSLGLTSGRGVQVTTGSTIHTKGAWAAIGQATAAVAGFFLFCTTSSSATSTILVDVAIGEPGAETVIVPNLPMHPLTIPGGLAMAFIPLDLPVAGTKFSVRGQSNGTSRTFYASIEAVPRTAAHPPLWSSCELLVAADLANTRVSSVSVGAVSAINTGWTAIATTGKAYGAVIPLWGGGATPPSLAQEGTIRLGAGGSGATDATLVKPTHVTIQGAVPVQDRMPWLPGYKSIASGVRVAMELVVPTPGTDAIVGNALCFF